MRVLSWADLAAPARNFFSHLPLAHDQYTTNFFTRAPTPFGALPTIEAKLHASRAAVEKLHPRRSHLLIKPIYVSWSGSPQPASPATATTTT
jgi:hypothetical protein